MRRIFFTTLIALASAAAHSSDGTCVTSALDNPNACKNMSATRVVAGSNKRIPQQKPAVTPSEANADIPMGVVVDIRERGKARKRVPDERR